MHMTSNSKVTLMPLTLQVDITEDITGEKGEKVRHDREHHTGNVYSKVVKQVFIL